MKYYLEQKLFGPLVILLSVVFLPSAVVLNILALRPFVPGLFLLSLGVDVIYIALILLATKKVAHSCTYYLKVGRNGLDILYPNINHGTGRLTVDYRQICRFDYYRMTSPLVWLGGLFTGHLPRAVCITYDDPQTGDACTDHIGYMRYKDLRGIAYEYGIQLKKH